MKNYQFEPSWVELAHDKVTIKELREAQKAIYKNKLDKSFNVTDVNKEFCLLYGDVLNHVSGR